MSTRRQFLSLLAVPGLLMVAAHHTHQFEFA